MKTLQIAKTLVVTLGATVALTGAALADGCMGSKAYTADAGKMSKAPATQTAKSEKPAATPETKVAEKTAPAAEKTNKPS
ncbi:MAG: hypothetical protein AAFR60_03180 [Pseudomonadota bacterium]